jgi:zinc transport system substrate-binding protein
VFICVGGVSDSLWLDDVLSAVGNEKLTVIKMSDYAEKIIAELEGHSHSEYCHEKHSHTHGEEHSHGDGHHHESDEHIWTSLKTMASLTEAVASAFAAADPENADVYLQNAALYRTELNLLDVRYEATAALSESKTLIFADRFPFARLTSDYGLCHYAAFSGCSSESEASFASFVNLSKAITENGIKYVLVTENGDPGLANALGEQTGCGILTVNSMQSVSRKEIKEGITYLEIMKENLTVIAKALGVSA